MNWKRIFPTLVTAVLIATLAAPILAACSTAGPAPSTSPAASPAASKPSPSPASPSASASAKPPSAEEQAYQKVLENWKKVVETARTEGEAVMNSVSELDVLKKYEEAFNKLDPKIKIKFVRATGSVTIERMKAEAATKQYVINLYQGGSPATRPMVDQGLGQMVDDLPVMYEPGIQWIRPPLFDKPHETITYGFTKYHILINTNLVPAGQEPKTWKDLADPKWKDKMVFWEPRIPSIGQAVLGTLYNNPEYGPDVVKKIIDNTRVVPDITEATRMVARGEMALSVVTWQNYVAVKDAPVKMIEPQDGTISSPVQMVIAKTAPQPNTAKVFVNWLLGKEGQKILSEGGATLRPDIDFITKETQVVGAKFLPNVPYTWDFEMTKMKDAVKVMSTWLDAAGK